MEEENRKSLDHSERPFHPPKNAPSPDEDDPSDLRYLKGLRNKEFSTFGDCLQLLRILLGKKELVDKLVSDANLSLSPESALTRGIAAVLFCRALEIKGGVLLRVFGLSQRYALKELVYLDIFAPGPLDSVISGAELISVFSNCAAYLLNK